MKKIMAFLLTISILFTNVSTSLANNVNDIRDNPEIEISDILIEPPVGDRGSLDDLCRAGKKQYCKENRAKYNRPLTPEESKCIAAIILTTVSAISGLTVAQAISAYGLAIISCLP